MARLLIVSLHVCDHDFKGGHWQGYTKINLVSTLTLPLKTLIVILPKLCLSLFSLTAGYLYRN